MDKIETEYYISHKKVHE